MMKNLLAWFLFSCSSFFIVGCSHNVSPNTYDAADLGKSHKVAHGVVLSKRLVKLDTSTDSGTTPGAVAGGGMGLAAGSSLASHVGGSFGFATLVATTVAGAVAGGAAGHSIEHAINKQQAYEYIVKLRDGNTISVVQNLEMQLAVHQRVLVVYGARTRLLADTI